MSDRFTSVPKVSSPSMKLITFAWSWRRTPTPVGYEVSGPSDAEPILMLPAMTRSRPGPS